MKVKARKLRHSDEPYIQTFVVAWVTICVLFALIPLFITVINSLKTNDQIETSIFSMPVFASFGDTVSKNFSLAWSGMARAFFSSILLSAVGSFGGCVLGAILGYTFTYKQFPFKETLFMVFIAIMMIPSIMGMPILVPFMKNTLNLADTYIGYLLPNFAGGQVTGLFLFRTFFGQQPESIYESAKIEGANDTQILLRITVPLALPIILYKFVNSFSSLYNDYLWPSLILDSKMTLMPIMLTLSDKFTGGLSVKENGAMYAMYIISSIPLICTSIISMKFFSSGDFAAGMKL